MKYPLREQKAVRFNAGRLVATPLTKATTIKAACSLVRTWHTSLTMHLKLLKNNLLSKGTSELIDGFKKFKKSLISRNIYDKVLKKEGIAYSSCQSIIKELEDIRANLNQSLILSMLGKHFLPKEQTNV